MKYCSQCGASVEKGAGFCSGCGTSLSSVASKSTGVVLAEGARLDTVLVSEITVEFFEDDGS